MSFRSRFQIPAQGLLQLLGLGNVEQGDHHPVNHIVQSVIGYDPHCKPAAVGGKNLLLGKYQGTEGGEGVVVKSSEVNVETFKGVVQLSGFVTSKEAMDKAVDIARGINGVTSVRNDMTIK